MLAHVLTYMWFLIKSKNLFTRDIWRLLCGNNCSLVDPFDEFDWTGGDNIL